MNAPRKKSALKKYADIPAEELREALEADKAKYAPEEVDEIIEALSVKGNLHYSEWEVKLSFDEKGEKVVDKLKVSRPVVKISDEEAETLNAGIQGGGNTYTKMYFKN